MGPELGQDLEETVVEENVYHFLQFTYKNTVTNINRQPSDFTTFPRVLNPCIMTYVSPSRNVF